MSRLQNFVIGMVMAALGIAALLQVIPGDPVMRLISVMAVCSLSVIGALVFFVFAFKDREYKP
jgi:hypothetical protein